MMYNKLLNRQIQRYFPCDRMQEKYAEFLKVISAAYDRFEQDRLMLEHSIEICSEEMIELNMSEKKAHDDLKTFFENIEEVYFSVSCPGFKLIQISPACEKVFGYPATDFHADEKLWAGLVLEADKPVIESIKALMHSGSTFSREYRIKHRDGSERWVETKMKPTLNEQMRLVRIDGVTSDITKRKAVEIELELNLYELRKSNSELDKFVYSVSHDLRAPLSSILGIIEIAQDDTDNSLMLDHLKMMKGSIKKLDGFIGDILDYSRNARVEIKKEEINFKELIEDITQNLKYMGASNRMVDIKIDLNGKSNIYSDKSRLSIILNNLVSNAIRYQNTQVPNPFVDIKIDMSDTETDIIVSDNGIGIQKELHNKIFDMFYRVSTESVGSGLGLYIVKETVDKLKGKIEVESNVGKGTKFIVKIPNC